MTNMRERGVGHALNYSAEGDCLPGKEQDAVTARYLEICRALDVQGDFESKMAGHGWERGSSSFALKMVSRPRKIPILVPRDSSFTLKE